MGNRDLEEKRSMRFTLTACLLRDDDREGTGRTGFEVGFGIL